MPKKAQKKEIDWSLLGRLTPPMTITELYQGLWYAVLNRDHRLHQVVPKRDILKGLLIETIIYIALLGAVLIIIWGIIYPVFTQDDFDLKEAMLGAFAIWGAFLVFEELSIFRIRVEYKGKTETVLSLIRKGK